MGADPKFDDDNIKIYVKNSIHIGNKIIIGLKDRLHHNDAATKFYIDNSMVLKADESYVNDQISKIEHLQSVHLIPYLKRDGSMSMTNNLDMSNNKIINVNDASENLDVVNLQQPNSLVYSVSFLAEQIYLKKSFNSQSQS